MEIAAENASPAVENTVPDAAPSQEAPASPEASPEVQETATAPEASQATLEAPAASQDAAARFKELDERIKKDLNYRLSAEEIEFLQNYVPTEDKPEAEAAPEAAKPEQEVLSKVLDRLGVEDITQLDGKLEEVLLSKDQELQSREEEWNSQRSQIELVGKTMQNLMMGLRRGDPAAVAAFDKINGITPDNLHPAAAPKGQNDAPFNRDDLVEPEVYDYFTDKMSKLEAKLHEYVSKSEKAEAEKTEAQTKADSEIQTKELIGDLTDKYPDLGVSRAQWNEGFKSWKLTNIWPKSLEPLVKLGEYAEQLTEQYGTHIPMEVAYKIRASENMAQTINEKVKAELQKKLTGPVTQNTLGGVVSKKGTGVAARVQEIHAKFAANKNYKMSDEELEAITRGA